MRSKIHKFIKQFYKKRGFSPKFAVVGDHCKCTRQNISLYMLHAESKAMLKKYYREKYEKRWK